MLIEAWRQHFNTVRPHSSLDYVPPAPQASHPGLATRSVCEVRRGAHADAPLTFTQITPWGQAIRRRRRLQLRPKAQDGQTPCALRSHLPDPGHVSPPASPQIAPIDQQSRLTTEMQAWIALAISNASISTPAAPTLPNDQCSTTTDNG